MFIRSLINFGEVMDVGIGVNVRVLPDATRDISYCVVKKKKDIITVVESGADIRDEQVLYDRLKVFLQKGARVHMNMEGKPVLVRNIPGELAKEEGHDLLKYVPGIKKDDFVFQRYQGKAQVFLSLIRKEDLLTERSPLYANIVSFSLGAFILDPVLLFLQTESVQFQDYTLRIREGALETIEDADNSGMVQTWEIGGEKLQNSGLLAYASAMNLFLSTGRIRFFGLTHIQEAAEKHNVKREIFRLSRLALFIVFGILFINALVFFWLKQKVDEAEMNVSLNHGKSQKEESMQKTNRKVTEVFEGMGWTMNRIPLYYADQIASTVPREIQLNILEIGTLDEAVLRKDRRHSFDPATVKVQGTSSTPASLDAWITSLQKFSWVEKVNDQKYQHDARLQKGVFEFSIHIK